MERYPIDTVKALMQNESCKTIVEVEAYEGGRLYKGSGE